MSGRFAIIGLWLLGAIAALAVLFTGPPPNAEITQFLPRGATPEQRLLLAELRDSPVARLLLAEIRGAEPEQLAESSRRFAERARGLGGVAALLNGEGGLPAEIDTLLFRYRYLLTDSPPLTEPGLAQALKERLAELAAPVALPDRHRLPADPTAAYRRLLLGFAGSGGPQRLNGVWFDRAGERALLLIHSAAPAFDLDAQERVVGDLRAAFAGLPEAAGQTLELLGPAVFAIESRDRMRSQTERLTLAASLGIAALILLLFRSGAVVLAAALPVALSVLAGAAAVVLVYGGIHGITLAFGITLLGEAVDYPTYLFSHARGRSLPETSRALWPTLRLAALTSMVGSSALLFSGFAGLAQLGLFSMVGILAAALAVHSLLPALLPRFEAPPAAALGVARFSDRLAGRPWLPALLALGAGAYLLWLGPALWQQDLSALSPLPEERKSADQHLRAELGAPDTRQLLVVTAPDGESALQRAEGLAPALAALVAGGALTGFDSPARLLPSRARQEARRAALPAPEALRAALLAATAGKPFKAGLFEPFLQDVAAARDLPSLGPEAFAGTPLEVRFKALLRQREEGWVALLPLAGVADPARVAAALPAEPWLRLVDLAGESSRLVNDYRSETLRLVLLGALANLLLLWLRFRAGARIARVALPPFASVLVSAALLAAFGIQLSLFHLAALLLVFGTGIDYALFFDRIEEADRERDATVSAVTICNLTALLGFGLLALAEAPVLRSIGLTLALGTPLSLLFSALAASRSHPAAAG